MNDVEAGIGKLSKCLCYSGARRLLTSQFTTARDAVDKQGVNEGRVM